MSIKKTQPPIDWETALREFDNDEAFLLKLMSNFCSRFGQWYEEMQQMINNKDEALKRQVHKLKGAAGNLFTRDLYQLTAQWDEDLKEGNRNNSEKHLKKISKEVKRLEQYIEELAN